MEISSHPFSSGEVDNASIFRKLLPGLCKSKPKSGYETEMRPSNVFRDARPYVRWWWLVGPFKKADIKAQLEWLKRMGFGGVELAWISPTWEGDLSDSEIKNHPLWLGDEFQRLSTYTKKTAQKLKLGCDFTFGSSWPFGGSCLREQDIAQTFGGPSVQSIPEGWEWPTLPPVLNHLSAPAVEYYVTHLQGIFKKALQGHTSALFCDSLEMDNDAAWSPELWDTFEAEHGYSLREHIEKIEKDPNVRYDVRKTRSKAIVQAFYQTFTKLSHRSNSRTRVQCHGAPADLLSAYSSVDVPESESLLFPPAFSRIPASAATIARAPVMSCETFTCLYGSPQPDETRKKEHIGDLKLLFDAVVSHGVNQIVWHGMPYNALDKPKSQFFASVYVGPDAQFVDELPDFNLYMQTVCEVMRLGKNCHRMAVYLPNEDMMMRGELPDELKTFGAHQYWEMRHVTPPKELQGYSPVWLSGEMLSHIMVKDGHLCCGDMSVPTLYIDVEWLDRDALTELLRLVKEGGTIVLGKEPKQPGYNPSPEYEARLAELMAHPRTLESLDGADATPILEGEALPPFWCREHNNSLFLFLAHPATEGVCYPLRYGQYLEAQQEERMVRVHTGKQSIDLKLIFRPQESILLCISEKGEVNSISVPSKTHTVQQIH